MASNSGDSGAAYPPSDEVHTRAIPFVDGRGAPVARHELDAVAGRGGRPHRVVRGATENPVIGQTQDKLSVRPPAQSRERLAKSSGQEVADHFTRAR
jgi:hypothetical protein